MKHVLAENYERLFGKKLVKEDRVYSHILQGHEATEENAYDHARGLDWQEIPIKNQPLNSDDHQYIDTVNGVGIYYNRMADYYTFTDETDQDLDEGGDESWVNDIEQEYIEMAEREIENRSEFAQNVAIENGQMFDNVANTSWFVTELAKELEAADIMSESDDDLNEGG